MFKLEELKEELKQYKDCFPLAEEFIKRLPIRPLCTNNFENGIARRSQLEALNKTNIQANPHCFLHWLTFDIDRHDAAHTWEYKVLPPPNLIVINPANGRAHVSYLLKKPVYKNGNANSKPIYLFETIYSYFRQELDADLSYNCQTTKNPIHPKWLTSCPRIEPYELGELAEYLPAGYRKPKLGQNLRDQGCGRHVQLFDSMMNWASRSRALRNSCETLEKWCAAVRAVAEDLNAEFNNPMGTAEVKGIAKHVAVWIWKNFSEATFSEIQRARARKGRGKTGRRADPDSEASQKPWLSMGISRRKYYYQKKTRGFN